MGVLRRGVDINQEERYAEPSMLAPREKGVGELKSGMKKMEMC